MADREVQVAPGSAGEVVAVCPPGKPATGGGGAFEGPAAEGDRLLASGPVITTSSGGFVAAEPGQQADAWLLAAYNAGATTRTLVVSTACVSAEAGR